MKYRGPLGVVDAFKVTGEIEAKDAPIWLGEKIEAGEVRSGPGTLTLDDGTTIADGDFVVRDTAGRLHQVTAAELDNAYTVLEEARTT